MSKLMNELRSTPLAVLTELLEENVTEYNEMRQRGVPLDSPECHENSTLFLLYRKALEDRGVSAADVAAIGGDSPAP